MSSSWNDYKGWVAQQVTQRKRFYYRGQKDSNWRLKTSYHRNAESCGMSLSDYFGSVIHDVNYHVSSSQQVPVDLNDGIQYGSLLSKLQHHGFPTPLLDWTLSPYVAAYFAFKNAELQANSKDMVSIFIFDIDAWTKKFGNKTDFLNEVGFVSDFVPYATNNPRMIRQMGVTTATNVSDMLDFILGKASEHNQDFVWKFDIPASYRNIVMQELNAMGINDMTMFPDFDGICEHLKEVHFNSKQLVPVPPPPPSLLPPKA